MQIIIILLLLLLSSCHNFAARVDGWPLPMTNVPLNVELKSFPWLGGRMSVFH